MDPFLRFIWLPEIFFVYLHIIKAKTMDTEFVPYEQAIDLNDLGFKGYCLAEYRQWDGSGELTGVPVENIKIKVYLHIIKTNMIKQNF